MVSIHSATNKQIHHQMTMQTLMNRHRKSHKTPLSEKNKLQHTNTHTEFLLCMYASMILLTMFLQGRVLPFL